MRRPIHTSNDRSEKSPVSLFIVGIVAQDRPWIWPDYRSASTGVKRKGQHQRRQ